MSANQACCSQEVGLTVRWRHSPVLLNGTTDGKQRQLIAHEGHYDPNDERIEKFALSRSITMHFPVSTETAESDMVTIHDASI